MRKIWILATILLLILAACAATKETPKAPETAPVEKAPVTTETPPAAAPPAEVGRTPPPATTLPSDRQEKAPPTVTETKTDMSPQLKDMLKRADEKVTSLQYLYGGTTTNNLFLDTYRVKGTKLKIKKYSEDYYVREGYYDTVYIDLSLACCEELSRCRSANVDNTNKKFEVDTTSLNVPKTPYQWTKEVPADAKITGPQTFNERSVTAIKFFKDGSEYEMLIDDTYGVPHKVIITEGSGNVIKHQFNDMQFNSLKENDFNAPCD